MTHSPQSGLSIKALSKSFSDHVIISDFNLDLDKHTITGFLGPNGSGKTTLLSIIAGSLKKDQGECSFGNSPLELGSSGLLSQNYRDALFPWLTAFENVCYPLRVKGISKDEREKKVQELFQTYKIPFSHKSYPYELSGGQQQLISFLRAVAQNPALMLMDEPFSALDYPSKKMLTTRIEQLMTKSDMSIILVSHDIDELLLLADRLIVFEGPPLKIVEDISLSQARPRSIDFLSDPTISRIKKTCLNLITREVI